MRNKYCNFHRVLADNSCGLETSESFSCSSYLGVTKQLQRSSHVLYSDNEAYRHNIRQREGQTGQSLLSDTPTILLVVPSGGYASMTSTFNSNCVHRQSIVSMTKKPDSREPCHGEL
jgi:hypothetical protein